jgi:hypothetical protein
LISSVCHITGFSAKGSHGLYPDATHHTYEKVFNGDNTLNIDTGFGVKWET